MAKLAEENGWSLAKATGVRRLAPPIEERSLLRAVSIKCERKTIQPATEQAPSTAVREQAPALQ
ncbi:MAG: hypothetical protein ACK5G9_08510 [Akkermansiaceae bacterium]